MSLLPAYFLDEENWQPINVTPMQAVTHYRSMQGRLDAWAEVERSHRPSSPTPIDEQISILSDIQYQTASDHIRRLISLYTRKAELEAEKAYLTWLPGEP